MARTRRGAPGPVGPTAGAWIEPLANGSSPPAQTTIHSLLPNMGVDARRTADAWSDFLVAFVDYEELIARIKAKSLR